MYRSVHTLAAAYFSCQRATTMKGLVIMVFIRALIAGENRAVSNSRLESEGLIEGNN